MKSTFSAPGGRVLKTKEGMAPRRDLQKIDDGPFRPNFVDVGVLLDGGSLFGDAGGRMLSGLTGRWHELGVFSIWAFA